MNNEIVTTEQDGAAEPVTTDAGATADQQDAFLAGFDDGDVVSEADQPSENDTGSAQDASAEADQPEAADSAKESPAADEASDGQGSEGQAAPSWEIKHFDERITIKADDPRVPELLQKGYDYDRIRAARDELQKQLDAAKPSVEYLSDLAARANMSVTDFVNNLRVEAKKAQGMGAAEAKRAVDLETREAAVKAAEAQNAAAEKAKAESAARVNADVAEFARAFPDVFNKAKGGNPRDVIPASVWKDVDGGLSLTAAYSRYVAAEAAAQVKAANERAEVAAKNAANAARSTGSQRSAGNDAKNKDAFLDAFGD